MKFTTVAVLTSTLGLMAAQALAATPPAPPAALNATAPPLPATATPLATTATTPAIGPAATARPGKGAVADNVPLPPPSTAAQKLYSLAKNDILQVRTLLKSGRTQSAVGSGFLIGTSDLVVTNYHVVSQFALEPDTYVGEWVDTSGKRGNVELLAVDVLHDLAVVRVSRHGTGFFTMPTTLATLTQGQYLYSLGNPLDLGFAISEGAYNGVITRSFYDQLMFTGPINAGMSGGPSVTVDGAVAGINVSKRLDGELVSFLVPARYAQQLLAKVAQQPTPPRDFKPVVTEQLLAHQDLMVNRLLATPLTIKAMGPYRVPVPESEQMRCWGRSSVTADTPFTVDNTNCAMESAVFVSESLQTGQVAMRHQYLRSTAMDALRFSQLASASFKNESFGGKSRSMTGPQCTEQFVANNRLPVRAVLCVRAYRQFAGLYDFALLAASTDSGQMNLQSRLDARGVSYANGMRTARVFLEALGLADAGTPPAVHSARGSGSHP